MEQNLFISRLFIEHNDESLNENIGFSSTFYIFETNIEISSKIFRTLVVALLRAMTVFYDIQISCWVYKPELQRQFRLFQ